jgi:hypothetical protein
VKVARQQPGDRLVIEGQSLVLHCKPVLSENTPLLLGLLLPQEAAELLPLPLPPDVCPQLWHTDRYTHTLTHATRDRRPHAHAYTQYTAASCR